MAVSRAISFHDTAIGIADYTYNMTAYTEPVLNQPFNELELTPAFKAKAGQLGFHTLGDLLDQPAYDLLKLPGFDHRLLHEYVSYLEKEKLGHYIKP